MIHEIIHYFVLAICGALLLVITSKFILQNIIRKECFYYENREAAEERQMLKKAGIIDKEGKK